LPTRPKTFNPDRFLGIPIRDSSKTERDAFYSSVRWMRLRLAFLSTNPLCVDCLVEDKIEPATIAHHKAERLQRPDLALDPTNLEALCASCHTKRHKARPTAAGG
jgi:5-methylcytosine-specific restriction endonuclease McrA